MKKNEEDFRIADKFEDKNWNEIKSNDSWAIFKIMSEFVEGYEKLAKIVFFHVYTNPTRFGAFFFRERGK